MFKYGVVRMHDLLQDVQYWEKFYLCGRLQKPVCYHFSPLHVTKKKLILGLQIFDRSFVNYNMFKQYKDKHESRQMIDAAL